MLSVKSLAFVVPEKIIFKQVDFSLDKGQLLHLRGENGAGKTTLLRLLAGILQPTQGHIFYNHRSIYNDLSTYQRHICYVGHQSGINPLLTVQENCLFDLHWGRQKQDINTLLNEFGLAKLADTPCYRLSAGQKRRVALLRTVMTDASLWLLDEPLVALDKAAISVFARLLKQHLMHGGQVILTSHQDLPDELLVNKECFLS